MYKLLVKRYQLPKFYSKGNDIRGNVYYKNTLTLFSTALNFGKQSAVLILSFHKCSNIEIKFHSVITLDVVTK